MFWGGGEHQGFKRRYDLVVYQLTPLLYYFCLVSTAMKSVKEDIQRIGKFLTRKHHLTTILQHVNPNKFGENNI